MSFGTKEKDDPPTNGEECDEGVARKEQEPPIPIVGSKTRTSQGHWPDVYTGKAGETMKWNRKITNSRDNNNNNSDKKSSSSSSSNNSKNKKNYRLA